MKVVHPGLKRFSIGPSLVRGLLAWALLLPSSAWASGHTIKVRPPSGGDDTAVIQAALDAAAANGPGASVQLAPGRYLSRQLLTFNFRGTFRGAGKDRTILQALPNLPVDCPDICAGYRLLTPDAKAYHWPSFIMFVDGDINLADLAVKLPATNGTALQSYSMCGSPVTSWFNAVEFIGQFPMNVHVDRILVEGMPDDSPTSYSGFNVFNGITFAGDLLKDTPDVQYLPLSGNFTVRNCTIRSVGAGLCNYFFFENARVTYGGSPATGNVFENVGNAMDLETAENSRFEVSYNRASVLYTGMSISQYYGDLFIPAKPSQFLVHDNHFTVSGSNPDPFFLSNRGIYLMNDPEHPWIQASVFNNTIQTQGMIKEGIGADNTKGTFLWNNTLTGSGANAIGLWGSTFGYVLGNHLRDFHADPGAGLAQVYLDTASSHNLVVCSDPLDTVLDQGTQNRVLGGWPQPKTESGSSLLKAAPHGSDIQKHPWRRRPSVRN